MSCAPQITQEMRSRGLRLTSQRLAILETLRHSGKHLTPREVYAKARESVPGLMETTVYRTLEFLVKHQLVFAAQVASGKLVYEAADHDHHHIICRNCHKEVEISHQQLEALYCEIEKSTGYRLTAGHLTFFGLCPDCQ
ncbi:MAG: Fur family transcriptional regulator [Anaerolineales bacterium]